MHSLPKQLPDFAASHILVVGDVMLDRYWFGDTARISPEAPIPVVKVNSTDHRPGGAANVALNIAALGGNATLFGITGNDEAATILEEQLNASNVKPILHKINHSQTIIKLRVISRQQQLLRLDFEETSALRCDDLLIEQFKKHLTNANLVILSDYRKGTLANPQTFIQAALNANVPIVIDPKSNDFSIYQGATIITPNMKEFETVAGTCHSEQEMVSKGRALLSQYNITALLITRGEDGMTLIQQDRTIHLPAYAREIADVTGAGDTVIGTLGAAVAAGCELPAAMMIANAAASIAVGKLGAATVSAPELQSALTHQTHVSAGIVNEEQLLQAVNEAHVQGKKVVFTNGCFDILHAGHVTYLQMAKQLGDYLVVAVNTDESIRRLKGSSRPVNNLDHRMTVLASLNVVDWVIPFADDTPERLLKLLKPDMLVKGGDYRIDQVVGADIIRAYGGEVRIMKSGIHTSSTDILKKINDMEASNV